MSTATIALDAMGGDHAPHAVVEAAALLSLESRLDLILVGDEPLLTSMLGATHHNPERIAVHHAPGNGAPNSLDEAIALVAQRHADAAVTAGHANEAVAACARHLSLLPGVSHGAVAAVFPTSSGHGQKQHPFSLILDVGAQLEASTQDLVGYAVMGAAYARAISKNPRPRVALLSNGREESRGPPTVVAAHRELARLPGIDFIGNVEGIDIPKGTADVVVTDGYVGDVLLKMLEGVAETVLELARYAYKERLSWRMGLTMLSGGIRQLKELTDWEQYGGAPILGFDRLVIKTHGRSGPQAIANACKVAAKGATAHLPESIAGLMVEAPLRPTGDDR